MAAKCAIVFFSLVFFGCATQWPDMRSAPVYSVEHTCYYNGVCASLAQSEEATRQHEKNRPEEEEARRAEASKLLEGVDLTPPPKSDFVLNNDPARLVRLLEDAKRGECVHSSILFFDITQKLGNGVYAMVKAAHPEEGLSDQALLKSKSIRGPGRLITWIKKTGNKEVQLNNGFSERVDVWEECRSQPE